MSTKIKRGARKRWMTRVSLPITKKRLRLLGEVCRALGCRSWRTLMREIADGSVVVRRVRADEVDGKILDVVDPADWECEEEEVVKVEGESEFGDVVGIRGGFGAGDVGVKVVKPKEGELGVGGKEELLRKLGIVKDEE